MKKAVNFQTLKVSEGDFLFNTPEEEIKEYLKIDCYTDKIVGEHLTELMNKGLKNYTSIPVCILSHKYDKKSSIGLYSLLKESEKHKLNRDYFIFTYDDQKKLYEEFEKIERVKVIYIPVIQKEYSTLSGKRNYILEWTQRNNYDDAFFVEDDVKRIMLPVGSYGTDGTKNFRNKKFLMSFNLAYTYWEFLIKKYKLTYSGLMNNMEFTFRDIRKPQYACDTLNKGFIKRDGQTVQIVHINTKLCKEKNLKFDPNSGWDDYDFLIQQSVFSEGTQLLYMSYITPALKSGSSKMSAEASALAKRCEINTDLLLKKWGSGLARLDLKKGLKNAKVNWFTIKAAKAANVDLKKIIGLSNKEAKLFIKNYSPKGSNETLGLF